MDFDTPVEILRGFLQDCVGIQSLDITEFNFASVRASLLFRSTFSSLENIQIVRCLMDSYTDLACILSCASLPFNLRIETDNYIEEDIPHPWMATPCNLRSLDITEYYDHESYCEEFASGFNSIGRLDLTMKNITDQSLLRLLTTPSKGVNHLRLTEDWEVGLDFPEGEVCYEISGIWLTLRTNPGLRNGTDWTGGGTLQSIHLRQVKIGSEHPQWGSDFILALDPSRLESITLELHSRASFGIPLWDGFDWDAVDGALASTDRFPALAKLVVRHIALPGAYLSMLKNRVLENHFRIHLSKTIIRNIVQFDL